MKNVIRRFSMFVLTGFVVAPGHSSVLTAFQDDKGVRVIEVAAKKYEFSPVPIRVKVGVPVRLRFTSLDKTHGFKINLYPDGSDPKDNPGLIFSSPEDCFKLDKGIPSIVQFIPRTPGIYSFHCCNRCGLGHGGMKGQLIVEP